MAKDVSQPYVLRCRFMSRPLYKKYHMEREKLMTKYKGNMVYRAGFHDDTRVASTINKYLWHGTHKMKPE